MPDRMEPEDLQGLIATHLETPLGEGELSEKREELTKRFFAEPYGDEEKGLSQVVDPSVRDVVLWALPEIMEIMLGAEKIANFEPVGPEDEEAAEQETDVVNHVALQMNPAFVWVYSLAYDALVNVVGYVDVSWSETKRRTTDRYRGVTEDQLTQIIAELEKENDGAEVEVLGQEEYTEEITVPDPMTGEPVMLEMPLLDVRLRVKGETTAKPIIKPVPPEEVVISKSHNSILLDEASFVAWCPNLPKSDLIAMGLDADQIEDLAPSENVDRYATNERATRQSVGENDRTSLAAGSDDHGAMQMVGFAKCYVRADYDGDGVAELLRVYATHSGEILKWDSSMKGQVDSVAWPYCIEEVEACGIVAATPFIVPHRHQGISLAELLVQSAKIKTALKRQLLDNLSLNNQPRRLLDENAETDNTAEDLAESGPAGTAIRYTSQRGGNPPATEATPDMVSNSLAALQYEDQQREESGITRLQQGLGGEALNTDTWRGQSQLMDAANKKLRMMARSLAETGFKRIFELVHMLLRKHGAEELAIRLRGNWVTVDPRSWRERSDMIVQVGLGTGNKELQLAQYDRLWAMQSELMMMGGVAPNHRFNTFEKILELMGIRAVERFAIDPNMQPWQPPAPPQDPMVQIKQIEAETSRMKLEVETVKIQLEREKLAFQAQMKAAELAIDESKVELEAAKAGAQIENERDRMRLDAVGKSADLAVDLAKADQAAAERQTDRLLGALANGQSTPSRQRTQ